LGPFPINPELSALKLGAGDIKRGKGGLGKRQSKGGKKGKNCQETQGGIRPAYMFKHWISFLQVGLPVRAGGLAGFALLEEGGASIYFFIIIFVAFTWSSLNFTSSNKRTNKQPFNLY
jgi:hypothetical protein